MSEIIDEGYVVHRRRLRESSYILQVLTRCHGLLGLVMRGVSSAKKQRGESPSEFKAFQFAWSGQADLPTVRRAEPLQTGYRFSGERLFCALYINELVVRFLSRGDANESAFSSYDRALRKLNDEAAVEPILRQFEIELLEFCGYAMPLGQVMDRSAPIEATAVYYYVPEFGPISTRPQTSHQEVDGSTLLALSGVERWTLETTRQAKRLMRFVIDYHLGGREIHSRALFQPSLPSEPSDL